MERYQVKNMFAPVAERIAPPVKATQPYGWRQRYRQDQRAQASVNTGEDTRTSDTWGAASPVVQPSRVLQPQPVRAPAASVNTGEDTRRAAPPAPAVRAPAPAASAPALPPLGAPSTPTAAPRVSQYGGPPPAAAPQAQSNEPAVPDPRQILDQSRQNAVNKAEELEFKEYAGTFSGDNANSFRNLPAWAQRKYAALAPAGYTVPAATSALDDMIAERASYVKGDPRWDMLGEKIAAEQARLATAAQAPRVLQPQPVAPPDQAQQLLAGYNAARYGS